MCKLFLIISIFLSLHSVGQPMRKLIAKRVTLTPDTLPLNAASGKSGYSLRKIRTAYGGSAVNVRRSSDNTTQDIGFDGSGNFDVSAFNTFVGGGNGFVATWYDQGVDGYNATQATQANQPQVTLSAQNGHPVLTFDGTDYLTVPSSEGFFNYLHSTDGMMVTAIKIGTVADPNAIYAVAGNVASTSSKTGYILLYDDRAAQSRNNALYSIAAKSVAGQAPIDRPELNLFTPNVFSLLVAQIDPDNGTAGNRIEYYINNVFTNSTNANLFAPVTTNTTHPFQIGANGNNGTPLVGTMAEIILYNVIHSTATRDAIALNIDNYYAY